MTDEDGYRLWLRYQPIDDADRLAAARALCAAVFLPAATPTLAAARDELSRGLRGLLGADVTFCAAAADATLIVGRPTAELGLRNDDIDESSPLYALSWMAPGGFVVGPIALGGRQVRAISSLSDVGVLYGVFHLLRHLQTGKPLAALDDHDGPRFGLRMLDHWDNLDGSIERGYAGRSLWRWADLPETILPRYRDYARANASIGINAVALNNVNASARMLTAAFLRKVAALADVFRPWGIRVFLSARFSAPIEIGGLKTADPLDADAAAWWRAKADEIYRLIPDFGGFLVKANSEGQPGPQDYGRTHADGANVLADALAPHEGVVIWRAFVYKADVAEDRAKQAYNELVPLDGAFRPNVRLQVKNGPIDFQPREPFHPLFGAMPRTAALLELQITQEYLGQGTHLAYLAPLFKEVLDADTHAGGPGATVARVADGSLRAGGMGFLSGGIAAVANTGDDRNWCGHPFAQANWYAFGRLAWDDGLDAAAIADEWLRLTFSHDPRFLAPAREMMLASREAVVDYMTPLGLHHIMAEGHHHGPGPWVDVEDAGRADWTSVYYHRADANGIGFDRTATGSDAVALYRAPLREQLADLARCPEALLLWFHHLPWDHRVASSGRTLWDELCHRYSAGVDAVRRMQAAWDGLAAFVDRARHGHVRRLLVIQEQEARWWRNACLLYFQTFSRRPLPAGLEPLAGALTEYRKIKE
ncbi:MAG TPA: alpha-glucuronidase family glycosyl hydrolase [Polyangia bacterium]